MSGLVGHAFGGSAEFVVASIRTCWRATGSDTYTQARWLPICADGSDEVIVSTIAAITTCTGLTVHAELDTRSPCGYASTCGSTRNDGRAAHVGRVVRYASSQR
jgi:hypothetical protein